MSVSSASTNVKFPGIASAFAWAQNMIRQAMSLHRNSKMSLRLSVKYPMAKSWKWERVEHLSLIRDLHVSAVW